MAQLLPHVNTVTHIHINWNIVNEMNISIPMSSNKIIHINITMNMNIYIYIHMSIHINIITHIHTKH